MANKQLSTIMRKRQVPNYCKHDGLRDGLIVFACRIYVLVSNARGRIQEVNYMT